MLARFWLCLAVGATAAFAQPGQPAPVQQSYSMKDSTLKAKLPDALQGVGIEQRLDQMVPLNLVFRDEAGAAEYAPGLAGAPRVRLMNVDLGPTAMEASTREDVEDEELPDEDRMQALLSVALLDSVHNRTEEALSRFNILLGYYQKNENQVMQAVVMSAFGDISQRHGDLANALHWYECAATPAAAERSPHPGGRR